MFDNLLGEIISSKKMVEILNLLGLRAKSGGKVITVEIPTFRIDLKTQEDLIEEIGRIWGYEKIKAQPLIEPVIPAQRNEILFFERNLRKNLIGFGFDEIYNYSFYSKQDAENFGMGQIKHFELANPMNPDQELVRARLIPNVLKNISLNLKYFSEFNIFEIGKSYIMNDKKQIEEYRMLTLAKVDSKNKKDDLFYQLKGTLEDLFENYNLKKVFFDKLDKSLSFWHPARTAIIDCKGEILGKIGEINPVLLKKCKIETRVVVAEIYVEKLMKVVSQEKIFQPLQEFPTVVRDISMIAKGETKAIDIQNLIKKSGGNLVMKVEMFDVFKKENQASFAYHIEFGTKERTLECREVDELMEKITTGLEKILKVEVRK